MGVLLCLPVLFVAGALQALPSTFADAVHLPQSVGQFMVLGIDIALLGAFITGLVVEKTRFLVLGIIAGIAVLFVVAAGACVLLLAGLASGN
jgi:branched-subunit amino acid transport protein